MIFFQFMRPKIGLSWLLRTKNIIKLKIKINIKIHVSLIKIWFSFKFNL